MGFIRECYAEHNIAKSNSLARFGIEQLYQSALA